jgi:CRISPR-associated exonuclease Cas4
VHGIADVVEIHDDPDQPAGQRVRPFPLDYKRGKPKAHRADEVQLCAQAIALEEMFGVQVPEGALYYGKIRRRLGITFDDELRVLTADAARATRAMIANRNTPMPVYERHKCEACSLLELCRPRVIGRRRNVWRWLSSAIES